MTREEAIEVMESWAWMQGETGKKDATVHWESTLDDVEEALDMAIAALREQHRWISVDERLPKRGKKVLCYMNYLLSEETKSWGTCVTENTYQGVLVGSNPRKHVWEWQGDFVTHWMPLPEASEVEV